MAKMRRVAGNMVVIVVDKPYNAVLDPGREEEHYLELVNVINELSQPVLTLEREEQLTLQLEALVDPDLVKKRAEIKEHNESLEVEIEEFAVGMDKDIAVKNSKRIASLDDRFEHDGEGRTYLKGYSMPMAKELVDSILDATYNPDSPFTLESLISFWKWVILNPNPEARIDLFKWFTTGQFSITDDGLIIAYRCVAVKERGANTELQNFVNNFHVKVKAWKKSPKNYEVTLDEEGNYLAYDTRNKKNPYGCTKQGNLGELFKKINQSDGGDVYTDNHTRTMNIKIGEEVSMPRENCDENRNASCSTGLHFMSVKYNLRLGDERLIILVNPMNVVAFPAYDTTKGRCCAYMPVGKAILDSDGKIEELDSGTYDFKYSEYTASQLDLMLKDYTISELVQMKLISAEVKKEDIELSKDIVASITKKRVIDVIK